jgi:hypothetical protein
MGICNLLIELPSYLKRPEQWEMDVTLVTTKYLKQGRDTECAFVNTILYPRVP